MITVLIFGGNRSVALRILNGQVVTVGPMWPLNHDPRVFLDFKLFTFRSTRGGRSNCWMRWPPASHIAQSSVKDGGLWVLKELGQHLPELVENGSRYWVPSLTWALPAWAGPTCQPFCSCAFCTLWWSVTGLSRCHQRRKGQAAPALLTCLARIEFLISAPVGQDPWDAFIVIGMAADRKTIR